MSIEQQAEREVELSEIDQLAGLSPLDYDRVRQEKADELGVRVATLDKLVKDARNTTQDVGDFFEKVIPWSNPVDGADLLSELSDVIRRFIVCRDETADTATLWVAMTWLIDVVHVSPLAVITAPEKRSGKSQLLTLLGHVSCTPLPASNITAAAMFRSIDAWKPTLLVDEADAFMRENEELRGLLNCGHTRDSAYIVRVVGDDHTPKKFNVWGAKAIAGIGHLADTLMDRAVVLELRRKLPHETVDRLRYAEPGLFSDLSSKLARFAMDSREAVRQARPELPAVLNDRAQDNWEPLLAIAQVAGGDWPTRARQAAIALSRADSENFTVGTELLSDIQELFESKRVSRFTTADLIRFLCEDDEKPWQTYNRGKSLTPRQLANKLRAYDIRSKNLKLGYADVKKGYDLAQFEEVFARYLSPENVPLPLQPNNDGASKVAEQKQVAATTIENATTKPAWHKEGSGVADRTGGEAKGLDL